MATRRPRHEDGNQPPNHGSIPVKDVVRILIVDDDPHIQEVVAFALETADHEVHRRQDGREAVAAANNLDPGLIVLAS